MIKMMRDHPNYPFQIVCEDLSIPHADWPVLWKE